MFFNQAIPYLHNYALLVYYDAFIMFFALSNVSH